jgi:hypothetical protein
MHVCHLIVQGVKARGTCVTDAMRTRFLAYMLTVLAAASHARLSSCSAPIIEPGPPVYSPGMMVAPGTAAVVSTGPDIIDIAIVSMFLVMAASEVFKGSGEDWESAGGWVVPLLSCYRCSFASLLAICCPIWYGHCKTTNCACAVLLVIRRPCSWHK